jgi:hypothetical protein
LPSWTTIGSGALTLLSTVTASAAATVDIETTFNGTYDNYLIVASRVRLSFGSGNLLCRLKLGGAYDSGASAYSYTVGYVSSATWSGANSSGAAQILIATDIYSNFESQFTMMLSNPTGTTYKKPVTWSGAFARDGSAGLIDELVLGAGGSTAVTALTGVRFLPSSGNISGTFRLYGIANS